MPAAYAVSIGCHAAFRHAIIFFRCLRFDDAAIDATADVGVDATRRHADIFAISPIRHYAYMPLCLRCCRCRCCRCLRHAARHDIFAVSCHSFDAIDAATLLRRA